MSKSLSIYVAKKVTRRYLQDTAVSLKKGDFNTPPRNPIFQKGKRRLFFKAAADHIGVSIGLLYDGFFSFAVVRQIVEFY